MDEIHNSFIDKAKRETAEKIEEYTRRAEGSLREIPAFSQWENAVGWVMLLSGVAGILFRGAMSWFLALLLGAVIGLVALALVYLAVRVSREAENRRIRQGCEAYARECEEEERQRIRQFESDIKRRCNAYKRAYNNAPVQDDALIRWLEELFERTILEAPQDSYRRAIFARLHYTVLPAVVRADASNDSGQQRKLSDVQSFVLYEHNLQPLTTTTDNYQRQVDTAAYARLLCAILKDHILGDEEEEGKFAYAPGQYIKTKETRASITLDKSGYAFCSNEYVLQYSAPNPQFVPPRKMAGAEP